MTNLNEFSGLVKHMTIPAIMRRNSSKEGEEKEKGEEKKKRKR